jgi:hypothetical protein
MRIEISDEHYWKWMNYYDGLLYCSLLDIGGKMDWRMPTIKEYGELDVIEDWERGDNEYHNERFLTEKHYWVKPIRDDII